MLLMDWMGAKDALSDALLAPQPKRHTVLKVLTAYRDASTLLGERGPLHPELALAAPPVVHAVGVGRKIVDGVRTETLALRVYVTRKAPLAALPPQDRVPKEIEGLPTDVIAAPPADFLAAVSPACTAARKSRTRPLIGGISTSHISGETGTLGYFCRSTNPADSPGDIYVLSNAHVYSKYSSAHKGDLLIQPGAVQDKGGKPDGIGAYERDVPLVFGGAKNEVDAAIGKLAQPAAYKLEICSIGAVNGTAEAEEDDIIAKHGRTSGYTEGVVDEKFIDFTMVPSKSVAIIKFRNQMRLIPRQPDYQIIGKAGDSGALITHVDGKAAVGLFHSAAPDGSYGYASHIGKVTSLLQVALM